MPTGGKQTGPPGGTKAIPNGVRPNKKKAKHLGCNGRERMMRRLNAGVQIDTPSTREATRQAIEKRDRAIKAKNNNRFAWLQQRKSRKLSRLKYSEKDMKATKSKIAVKIPAHAMKRQRRTHQSAPTRTIGNSPKYAPVGRAKNRTNNAKPAIKTQVTTGETMSKLKIPTHAMKRQRRTHESAPTIAIGNALKQAPVGRTKNRTEQATPIVKTNDTTEYSGPTVQTHDTTKDTGPTVKIENTTENTAPPVKTEKTTEDAGPPVKTENTTEEATPPVKTENTTEQVSPPVTGKNRSNEDSTNEKNLAAAEPPRNDMAEKLARRLNVTPVFLTDTGNSWYIHVKSWCCPVDINDFLDEWEVHSYLRKRKRLFDQYYIESRWTQCWGVDLMYGHSYSGVLPLNQGGEVLQYLMSEANELIEGLVPKEHQIPGGAYQGCLQNWYVPTDNIGMHRDSVAGKANFYPIFSLSWGGPRRFRIQSYKNPKDWREVVLNSGDLFVMGGEMQQTHQHGCPKVRKQDPKAADRINWTLRAFDGDPNDTSGNRKMQHLNPSRRKPPCMQPKCNSKVIPG